VEREIAGAAVHEYRILLKADSFLRVRIEPRGIGVKVRLLAPAGEESAAVEDPGGSVHPDRLSLVAPAGDYRLAVAARDPRSPRGRYRLVVEDLRAASPQDPDRVAADRAFAAGRLALAQATAAAKAQAQQRFEEALAAWKAVGDPTGQVDALLELAEIDSDEARWDTVLERCREALRLARAAGYSGGAALAYRKMGDAYSSRSETDKALEAYRESLSLAQTAADVSGRAATLYGMGFALQDKGRIAEALEDFQQALPLRRQAGDRVGEAVTLTAIAGIRQNRGEISEALELFNQALALSRSVGDARTEATVLSNLSNVHKWRGELEEALESQQEALSLNESLGDLVNLPTIHHNLGSLYVGLGDSDKALSQYQTALELCRKGGGCEARELHSIGWVRYLRGDARGALESARNALGLARDARTRANASNTIGVALIALRNPQEARASLTEALALRQSSGGSVLEQAQSLLALANARRDLGETAAAEEGYRQVLATARQVPITVLEAQCLYQWALLDRDAGRLPGALAKIRQAVDTVESIRNRVINESLRTSFFASMRPYYELWIDLLMRLEEQNPGGGAAAEALEASEKARARALLDLLTVARIDVEQGVAPALKGRETDLTARLSWLQNKLFTAAPAERPPFQEEIGRIEEELGRLEAEIRRSDPRYAQVRYPTPLGLPGVQTLLDDDTALLEYFVGTETSALFVITRSGLAAYRLPPAEILARGVRNVRDAIQGGQRRLGDYVEQAGRLYSLLLAPAAAGPLAGKSRLLIAPDSSLYLLPFDALLTRSVAGSAKLSDFPYLLQAYAVAYVPSASVLAGLRAPRPEPTAGLPPKQFVAFADPVIEKGTGPSPLGREWARLLRSEGEARAIAGLYPPDEVKVYVREEATKEQVTRSTLVGTARRLHFATHGFVTEPPFSLSGLVLTSVPGSPENSVLSVRDIFNLRLNADLVTLSACETGLGREVSGEGVVGMTRAFLYAGARSLLVSFWKVSDASTPRLMESFYRHLGERGGKTAALRRAKLEMIAGGSYAEPYYWAPFLLSGDP
jgi:CHAT domain-containing protein/Tfp pilus assembly protein PilF